jgi:hypothetical protein
MSAPCGPHRNAIGPATLASLTKRRDGWRIARNAFSAASNGGAVALRFLARPPVDRRGRHGAWTDRVAGDPGARALQRHRAGQAQQSGLGRHVVDTVDGGETTVDRGHVDDAAPVFSPHRRQGQADGMESGGQIDRQRLIPVFGREILHRAEVTNDGVVDQNVGAPWVRVVASTKAAICAGSRGSALWWRRGRQWPRSHGRGRRWCRRRRSRSA